MIYTHCRVVDLERPHQFPIPLAWVVQLDFERALQFDEHDLVIRDLHQSGWELEVGWWLDSNVN